MMVKDGIEPSYKTFGSLATGCHSKEDGMALLKDMKVIHSICVLVDYIYIGQNKNAFQLDAYRPLIDRISSYPTHAPPFTMHGPLRHACPFTMHPPSRCMPAATTHAPPHNHACPLATMHAPLATTHAPLATMHAPQPRIPL